MERQTHQILKMDYKGTVISVVEDSRDKFNPYRIYLHSEAFSNGRWHTHKRMLEKYGDFQSVMCRLAQMQYK